MIERAHKHHTGIGGDLSQGFLAVDPLVIAGPEDVLRSWLAHVLTNEDEQVEALADEEVGECGTGVSQHGAH